MQVKIAFIAMKERLMQDTEANIYNTPATVLLIQSILAHLEVVEKFAHIMLLVVILRLGYLVATGHKQKEEDTEGKAES